MAKIIIVIVPLHEKNLVHCVGLVFKTRVKSLNVFALSLGNSTVNNTLLSVYCRLIRIHRTKQLSASVSRSFCASFQCFRMNVISSHELIVNSCHHLFQLTEFKRFGY